MTKGKVKTFKLISKETRYIEMPCGNTGDVVSSIYDVGANTILKRNRYECGLCGSYERDELFKENYDKRR